MRVRIGALVPGAGLTADDGERVGRGVVGHPEADDAGFEHLGRPRRFDLRKKTLSDRAAGPDMHWYQTLFFAPGFQLGAHSADRSRRILPSHDRFVEYALHAALPGEVLRAPPAPPHPLPSPLH